MGACEREGTALASRSWVALNMLLELFPRSSAVGPVNSAMARKRLRELKSSSRHALSLGYSYVPGTISNKLGACGTTNSKHCALGSTGTCFWVHSLPVSPGPSCAATLLGWGGGRGGRNPSSDCFCPAPSGAIGL